MQFSVQSFMIGGGCSRVLTARDDGHSSEVIYGLSRAETECLLNLFEHRQECIILFDKSDGTKYETEKDRFIAAIEEHLNKHKKNTDGDEIFIHIIANNFAAGLMQVMCHYKEMGYDDIA